jgi:hypothetical protein
MGRLVAPLTFGSSTLPETADRWREILRDAIEQVGAQPLVGTQYRSAVDAAAAKHGLQFPPPNEPALRFVELIQRYPDIVSIARRPGQDFLVVPAGRSDLLTEGVQHRPYGIRKDLFEAFTFVGESRAYYDQSQDKVVWQSARRVSSPPESWIAIECPTLESEIKLRRDFVESLSPDSDMRVRFDEALASTRPLQAFGVVVRETGVQRKWHAFRIESVLARMESWARSHAIGWKDAWLTEGRNERLPERTNLGADPSAAANPAVATNESDPLKTLFSGLDAADIQRISIPLDLVLKAISAHRKP